MVRKLNDIYSELNTGRSNIDRNRSDGAISYSAILSDIYGTNSAAHKQMEEKFWERTTEITSYSNEVEQDEAVKAEQIASTNETVSVSEVVSAKETPEVQVLANDKKKDSALKHTHEYLGRVATTEIDGKLHDHSFSGTTGEAISLPGQDHYHLLDGITDATKNHFHKMSDKTGPAVYLGNGNHVHLVHGSTLVGDGHLHEYIFSTLINVSSAKVEQPQSG